MPTALIWGAGGGIGRALLEHLAEANWTVWAMARQPESLKALTPFAVPVEVSRPDTVQQAVAAIEQTKTLIDLWAYAIGDIVAARTTATPPEVWQRILDANLHGPYLAFYYSQPILAPDAHLFFLGAVSERLRLPRLAAYATAKAGLEAFVDTLGKEERGRLVTLVRPQAVNTPFWRKVPFQLPRRALQPNTVAQAILDAYHSGQKGTLDL